MEKMTFQKWMALIPANKHHFFLIQLNISHQFWENYFFPKVKTRFQAEGVFRVDSDKSWKSLETNRLHPMLFPKKEILLLDGVSEALAFQIAHGKTSHPHSFFLYIVQNKLTKSWNDIPLVQVEFTEEEFRQWIQKIAGKSLYSQLSAPVLHSLYQRWKDFDLGEEDIFSFFHHYQPLTGLIPLDVELFFEKSEKTLLFRFIDALSDRNAELATKYFFSLQKINYPPNLLVVMVARRYRLIHQILLIGVDNQDLWKKNKVSPFEIRKIKNFAKKYSPSEITNIFSLLRDLDRLSKTVHCDFSDLMLDLIAQISVKILPSRSERVPSAFSPDEI